jgi:N-dimethylarginine dimethylaminohydrolase
VEYRGACWSSVPLGSPAGVDGPFLEGSDMLLNGREIYVGISRCASDLAGADWLQALLGTQYRVIPVAMRSNVLHLDWVVGLIKPGLLVHCPERLIDGLPMTLRSWDKVQVSTEEANRLATQGLVLEGGRIIVDADNSRLVDELRKRKVDVVSVPFDGPIAQGSGLRSVCQPLLRRASSASPNNGAPLGAIM